MNQWHIANRYHQQYSQSVVVKSIDHFHNNFSSSGEQPNNVHVLAHKSEQPTAGCIEIFHKNVCYIKPGHATQASAEFVRYTWGGGYKANFLGSVIFWFFQYYHNTRYILNITFIFDRCRHSSAAVAPVKYKCDLNNLRGTFARTKILLTEKLTNGALVTPTPGLRPIALSPGSWQTSLGLGSMSQYMYSAQILICIVNTDSGNGLVQAPCHFLSQCWPKSMLSYGVTRPQCVNMINLHCFIKYRQVSNIRHTLVGNKIVDHSDVVGASPVGAAPTTSSFST